MVLVGLGLGSASAHTARTPSQHTLSFAADVFSGQLESAPASCERGRAIELYRTVGDASVPDERVATAKSNKAGRWSKPLAGLQAGDYYSVALKKVKKNALHKHVCKQARSNAVTRSADLPPSGPSADVGVSNAIEGPQSDRDYIYQVTVSNAGPDSAQDLAVTLTVPANFTVKAANGGCAPSTGAGITITCPMGPSFGPGTSPLSVEGFFTGPAPGDFSSTVASPTDDPQPSNNNASLTATARQCSDGFDNDSDGQIDHPNDLGCNSPVDDAESPNPPQCSDGVDNDADSKTDFPDDLGCSSNTDDSESPNPPQCADGVDNDNDGQTDHPEDWGCDSIVDDTESPNPECSDGIDNDGDGGIDYQMVDNATPRDFGCESYSDDTESPNPECSNGTDDDTDNKIDMQDPGCGHPTDNSESPDPPPEADWAASDRVFPQDDGVYQYQLDFSNNGPAQASGPSGTLTVPANVTITATSPTCSASVSNPGTVDCTPHGSIFSVGGQASFWVKVRFTSPSTGTFTGTVTPPTTPTDPNLTNNSDSRNVTPTQCADGTDNDGDGRLDFPDDPDCASGKDTIEQPRPECSDGADNDADNKVDFPADPGCSANSDPTESPDATTADVSVVDDFYAPNNATRQYYYQGSVVNNGPGHASGMSVTITVPGNFTVESHFATCSQSGNTLTCPLFETYANGGSANVSVTGHFTSPAEGTFSSSVTSTTTDPDLSNNADSRTGAPTQCSDYTDNDGDGQVDTADSNCSSPGDTTED